MLIQQDIENRIDAVIRFFLYVLIFMLPFSPAAVEICVSFSMVLWFVKRTLRIKNNSNNISTALKHYLPKATMINVYIYWFLLACIFSAAGSVYMADSFKAFFTKIFEWFIIYFLVLEVMVDKKHFKTIAILFIISSFVLIADGLLQYYLLRKDIFFGRILNPGDRATAAFKTPSDFGGYLTVAVPFMFILIFYRFKNVKLKVVTSIMFILGLCGLWIVQARAAWMGVLLAVLLFCIVRYRGWLFNKANKFLKMFMVILVILLFVAGIKIFIFSSNYRPDSIEWREMVWKSTAFMIKDKPFFGHGVNTFMKVFQIYCDDARHNPTYAHNSILQMAAEVGMIGLFCFLMTMIKLFKEGYTKLINGLDDKFISIVSLGSLTGALALFIQSISDTSFQSLQLSALFWYLAGLSMAGVRMLNEKV